MAKQIITQNSFGSGEISPKTFARQDTNEYRAGLETCKNATITAYGTAKRRNGTKFIAEAKDLSTAVKLVRFQISKDISYVLEFGNTYIRFFTDSGQVTEANVTVSGLTQADPAVVTATSHGFSNGDHVYITGVVGMTEINNTTLPYVVANKTTNTFELQDTDGNNIDSSAYTAYSSGGVANRIYEITSPYSTSDLDSIQYTQSGSTLYIAHPDYEPRQLVFTSSTSWEISTISLAPPPTYESGFESTGVTITPAATTGVDVNFTASGSVFLEGDIGRQIINSSSGETGRASIVSVTSATVAVCDIIEDFTDTNAIASDDWKMDLSPVVDLEIDGSQAGSIVNIRSEYTAGSLGQRFNISGISAASPAVLSTSTNHDYVIGDTILLDDIVGMTELNGDTYQVASPGAATTQLKDGKNGVIDTSTYNAYSSGGIVRKVLTGLSVDAFRSADVGKYILVHGGVGQIVTVNSATDIDVEVIKSFNSTDTTGNWTLETETWTSTRGYPKSVGQFQDRLVFGGTTAQPKALWFSEIGIPEGFGVGADDEDSIEVELGSNENNEISWLSSGRDLIVGTAGGEVTVDAGSNTGVTATNIRQTARTYLGSASQIAQTVRDETLFIQNSARKIRTLRYDFNIDGYISEDLTFLSEHMTEGGIKEIVFSQEPDNIIYAVTNNGDLLSLTYDRSKKIIAASMSTTNGDFKNVSSISEGEVDQVWVAVERTINGVTNQYIELFVEGNGVDDLDAFQDSYLTLSENKSITGVSLASPAVVTAASHGFSDGDIVVIKDLVDPHESELDADKTNITELNKCVFTVANKTTNTFELTDNDGTNIDTSNYNSYGSSGNVWKQVTSITGLNHLEGEVVTIRGDGAKQPNKTVSSGAVTLSEAAGEVVIGLPYTTTIKTLDIAYNSREGNMQGQRVRWARPLLNIYRSTLPLIDGQFLPSRNNADKLDKKVPLYSGFVEYGPLNWANSNSITFTTNEPLPLELRGLTGVIDNGVK